MLSEQLNLFGEPLRSPRPPANIRVVNEEQPPVEALPEPVLAAVLMPDPAPEAPEIAAALPAAVVEQRANAISQSIPETVPDNLFTADESMNNMGVENAASIFWDPEAIAGADFVAVDEVADEADAFASFEATDTDDTVHMDAATISQTQVAGQMPATDSEEQETLATDTAIQDDWVEPNFADFAPTGYSANPNIESLPENYLPEEELEAAQLTAPEMESVAETIAVHDSKVLEGVAVAPVATASVATAFSEPSMEAAPAPIDVLTDLVVHHEVDVPEWVGAVPDATPDLEASTPLVPATTEGDPVAPTALQPLQDDWSHGKLNIPPDKELFQRQYYTMRETTAMMGMTHAQLRSWEHDFDVLQPRKNRKGDRYFRPADIKNLELIYHLIKEKKYTTDGAKAYLKQHKHALDHFALVKKLEGLKSFLFELKANL